MRKKYFVSVKFFVLLKIRNCEIKRLLHEKVKVYRRQDTGSLGSKKQTLADAQIDESFNEALTFFFFFFLSDVLSYLYCLLTIQLPPITEIYIELYGWKRFENITEMNHRSNYKMFVGCPDVLPMRNRILLSWQQDMKSHKEFTTESLVILRYHQHMHDQFVCIQQFRFQGLLLF